MHYLYLFFVNDTAATEIYTLSLHDALPILSAEEFRGSNDCTQRLANRSIGLEEDCRGPIDNRLGWIVADETARQFRDRKSTRLNSSHRCISYAVFCLKKKTKKKHKLNAQT